jgi:hypothetical protein
MNKIIAPFLGFCILLSSAASTAQTVYFSQPVFSGVSGNVYSNVANGSNAAIYSYGVGDITHPFGGWNVADFTKLNTGTPLQTYQSGYASSTNTYGATAVQVKGEYIGVHLNAFTGPQDATLKNISYSKANANLYPWKSSLGADPNACLSFDMSIPGYYSEGAVLYVTPFYYIVDTVTNKRISLMLTAWDSRYVVSSESYVGYDPVTISYMFASYYGPGSRYVEKNTASSNSQTGLVPDLKWMSSCVSRNNILNLIRDSNLNGFGFSQNPDNYLLDSFGVQTEAAIINGMRGWVSTKIGAMWLIRSQ